MTIPNIILQKLLNFNSSLAVSPVYFLNTFQFMCVCVCSVPWSCPTLYGPMARLFSPWDFPG